MKRYASTLLILCLALGMSGCGGTNNSIQNEVQTSKDAPNNEVVQEQDSKPEFYFQDNVLVSEDVKIEITDYKIVGIGEAGNEYGDKPVIAFWYDTTVLSDNENIDPSTAWIVMFTAIQDNDENRVNTLEVGFWSDPNSEDYRHDYIKPGGTVSSSISYSLDDEITPVTLKATKGIAGDYLGEQIFQIT